MQEEEKFNLTEEEVKEISATPIEATEETVSDEVVILEAEEIENSLEGMETGLALMEIIPEVEATPEVSPETPVEQVVKAGCVCENCRYLNK